MLPGLLALGLGFGLIMAPSMATATAGVQPADAGVASAMVNTAQQVGGSIGTALLSTVFAHSVASFAPSAGAPPALTAAHAAVHGYTVAFWWGAAILAAGAIVVGLLMKARPAPAQQAAVAENPVPAH